MRHIRRATLAIVASVAMVVCVVTATGNAFASAGNPTGQTCTAFRAWNHHKTTANLDAMLTASESAPWANLGNDVTVVYADVRGHNTYDLTGDVKGIATDCKGR